MHTRFVCNSDFSDHRTPVHVVPWRGRESAGLSGADVTRVALSAGPPGKAQHCCNPRAPGWGGVLLLAQLPASPSSPRVALWRRARAAGAAGLQNGVRVLPRTAGHAELLAQLAETVRGQGGSAFVLAVPAPDASVDAEIAARFGADRAREYAEFAARADGHAGRDRHGDRGGEVHLRRAGGDRAGPGQAGQVAGQDRRPGLLPRPGPRTRRASAAALPRGGGQVRRGGVCGQGPGGIRGAADKGRAGRLMLPAADGRGGR